MAEHRASVNALHSIFLTRGDQPEILNSHPNAVFSQNDPRSMNGTEEDRMTLPTEAHALWALEAGRVGRGRDFFGDGMIGSEVVVESAR